MIFQKIELTTALRPELLDDESILFVQDSVGLYEGKLKVPTHQDGQIYLTSFRVCYVDKVVPRTRSIGIELKHVERCDYTAGFLKASPKITLYPKTGLRGNDHNSGGLQSHQDLTRQSTLTPVKRLDPTWICSICSFSNTLPATFDATQSNASALLKPCSACGIKPTLDYIAKVISKGQPSKTPASLDNGDSSFPQQDSSTAPQPFQNLEVNQCARCTFVNHPSLSVCEICGAALVQNRRLSIAQETHPESPGPSIGTDQAIGLDANETCKLSFRNGGDRIFLERLRAALDQRRWLLQDAPTITQAQEHLSHMSLRDGQGGNNTNSKRIIGLAGLERLSSQRREANQNVISSAFTDLEALMASAKEIIALAESFASQTEDKSATTLLHESASALNMALGKDSSGSDSLYLSELSRTLAEYLTDDRQGVLKQQGGIMSLVDLYATYNRAINGVGVASPGDFEKAARLWEEYKLPVRLRRFKSGVMVVQRSDWSDDKIVALILAWLQELRMSEPAESLPWDWKTFGRGVTAQEAVIRFGWSLGVATEELEMAEERGVLCKDVGVGGISYWDNAFLNGDLNVSEQM